MSTVKCSEYKFTSVPSFCMMKWKKNSCILNVCAWWRQVFCLMFVW